MNKRYISWKQMKGYVAEIARQIAVVDDWRPDLIIGITRGGAFPAVMLSHFLEVKMIGLDAAFRDTGSSKWTMGPESNAWAAEDAMNGRNILIVDDINDTGATVNWIIEDWTGTTPESIKWGENVRFATVVDNLSSKAIVKMDYCGLEIDKGKKNEWIVFPYENWWMNDNKI